MIIKAVFYEKEVEQNPHHEHVRMLEVCDFHIDAPSDSTEKCSHELIYHTDQGGVGTLLLGLNKENADHLYVMEGGKTVDHMRFYAN